MRTRIVIADDHALVRQGFISLLAEHREFEIVAEAEDGWDALRKIMELKPDVAILDISMPRMTGFDVIREAKKKNIGVEFVILTMFTEKEYYDEAMEIGVKGYVLKENSIRDLVAALSFATHGMKYVSPLILKLLGEQRQTLASPDRNKKNNIDILTSTERKVLKLLSEGKTSKDVGKELNISHRTVQNHRSNICEKLKLTGHNTLLAFAVKNKEMIWK